MSRVINRYRVTVGNVVSVMPAPNIQAASQFVRHWPSVTVRRILIPTHDMAAYFDRCALDKSHDYGD